MSDAVGGEDKMLHAMKGFLGSWKRTGIDPADVVRQPTGCANDPGQLQGFFAGGQGLRELAEEGVWGDILVHQDSGERLTFAIGNRAGAEALVGGRLNPAFLTIGEFIEEYLDV
jgi:hypothetical protein